MITLLISRVGFPIAVCAVMLWYGFEIQGFLIEELRNREVVIKDFTKAIDANTKAINSMGQIMNDNQQVIESLANEMGQRPRRNR